MHPWVGADCGEANLTHGGLYPGLGKRMGHPGLTPHPRGLSLALDLLWERSADTRGDFGHKFTKNTSKGPGITGTPSRACTVRGAYPLTPPGPTPSPGVCVCVLPSADAARHPSPSRARRPGPAPPHGRPIPSTNRPSAPGSGAVLRRALFCQSISERRSTGHCSVRFGLNSLTTCCGPCSGHGAGAVGAAAVRPRGADPPFRTTASVCHPR